ncbi:hypothetical protein TNCV_4297251 [Trichonephila clavipes]|nr:hypothetical protein TNCV_4297251 [Trichonephila clavipes]
MKHGNSGMKATVDEIVKHIVFRQGQSQPNAVKPQDCGNSVLGPARCFLVDFMTQRTMINSGDRKQQRNFTEAQKSTAKQTAQHAVKKSFDPPR